ncbi:MAG: hypothetical protein COW27_05430 [Nitrosopumilales archaeon CG15_BIG_FIL_POST_REV_8_21_14_020_37_12]|nr:MAG: hypothetical protein COW27_05430 [Nitrosopumilales archaeon CG15_BIG_FIL_POST_REV_8_21_14_020_37_12]
MKICNICNRISATDQDHLDCVQRRRVELEDEDLKKKIPEKLDIAKNPQDLGVEVRAILEHLSKEKEPS